ncbi:CRISPR-associated helicase Cas3' [Kocuria rhizophila]|uniref:CRISPR-associated helicase Cas3' n=1 Tax=Kocuria rhizophila TaxID=72000 RepID=UPI003879C23D
MPLSPDAWQLWAKTPGGRGREAGEGNLGARVWLALPQHLRDASDVGERLVGEWLPRQLRERLAQVCGGDHEQAARLVGFLCGVHDVGKAECAFQSQLEKSPEHGWLWDQVRSLRRCPAPLGSMPDPRPQHAEVSDLILRGYFERHFPQANGVAIRSLTVTAGCHHGRLGELGTSVGPGGGRAHLLWLWLERHGSAWGELWDQMIDDIAERTGARAVLQKALGAGGLGIADQLMLCGLVTMADWIASNQDLFPLSESGRHVSDHTRADEALARLDLTQAWQPPATTAPPYRRRFGWPEDAVMRPCQTAAVEAASRASGPRLMIIEEEMGQGKTEAALLAAEILAGEAGSGGVAFALPTMATADSMFARVKSWVETLEQDTPRTHSLFLGHSRSWLEPQNEKLIRQTRFVGGGTGQAVVAHEWFTGKKGLLAEFTVSTIDQVLMAALATRYVTMRHLGLAGKVVILDEVHSYDVFTSSYMERTLAWLAAHGVSVILLSATLASGLRERLERAYGSGLHANSRPHPDPGRQAAPRQKRGTLAAMAGNGRRAAETTTAPVASVPPYPRVSVTDGGGTSFRAIEQRSSHRRVRVCLLPDDRETLADLLSSRMEDGGVVGVVCNTVSRAQEVYQHLRDYFGDGEIELHHSQFTAWDRADREQRLVKELGPGAHRESGRPWRRVLVGTQVLEQSLDIDLDLLVTDLAPGDGLAQRAGRLHRHERPEGDRPRAMREPEVLVRGVDMAAELPVLEEGAEAIYGGRVLLATLAVLGPYLAGRPWCLTHELETVVEAIYAPDFRAPAAWQAAYEAAAAREEQASAKSRAESSVFQLRSPQESRGDLRDTLEAMTVTDVDRGESLAAAYVRDIEPTLEVLVVQEQGGLLSPLPWTIPRSAEHDGWFLSETVPPPPRFARAVAMSTVRLPRWLVAPWNLDAAIAELEALGIPAWQEDFRLRGQLVIRLDQNLHGSLLGTPFGYDRQVGIHRLGPDQMNTGDPFPDDDFELWEADDDEEIL